MNEILQGLIQAFWLVLSFDSELITISLRSLYVTVTALVISALIAFPLAAFLVVTRFTFRRAIVVTLNALMGLPPVVVGLIVYILFSRSGPFGVLGLLYTTSAMIIAQVIIITPLITSIAHQSMLALWAFRRARFTLHDFSHDHRASYNHYTFDNVHSAPINAGALGRLSQSSYFHKYIKNAACSNIDVGQQKSFDYCLFSRVWPRNRRGWSYNDSRR